MKLYRSVCGTWEKHMKLTKNHAGLIGPAPLMVQKEPKRAQTASGLVKLENEEQQLIESMLKKKVQLQVPTSMDKNAFILAEFDS